MLCKIIAGADIYKCFPGGGVPPHLAEVFGYGTDNGSNLEGQSVSLGSGVVFDKNHF